MEVTWILAYLTLGVVVGFMAGLLGVGGGGILVPVLSTLFLVQGMPDDHVVHLSLGTSMACMVLTTISSVVAHNRRRTVRLQIVRTMSVGVIIGTSLSTFLVSYVNSVYLAIFFSLFMLHTATMMLRKKKTHRPKHLPNNLNLALSGAGIGGISALVSIGGGSLTVPYLVKNNIDIKGAIGTSAAVGLLISVAGTLGYVFSGWNAEAAFEHSVGFIHLPTVVFVSLASFITAPWGVNAVHLLNTEIIKKLFALMIIALSLKMLFMAYTSLR